MIHAYKDHEGKFVVDQRSNANSDWREIGELVQSAWNKRDESNRYDFKANGTAWIDANDLIALAERIKEIRKTGKYIDYSK